MIESNSDQNQDGSQAINPELSICNNNVLEQVNKVSASDVSIVVNPSILVSPFPSTLSPSGLLHPRFDTIFGQFPANVASIKSGIKSKRIRVDEDGGRNSTYRKLKPKWAKEIIPGLNDLSQDNNWIKFEISSKCLGSRFNDLLSIDTIDLIIPFLSPFLDFHTDKPLTFAHLSKCHLTVDTPITSPQSAYIQRLLLASNPRYKKDHHKDESVWFRRDLAEMKNTCSLEIYNRFLKLSRGRNKSKFLSSLPNLSEIVAYHEHRLRFELKLLRSIFVRQAFNLPAATSDINEPPPFLLDVLNSTLNPLSTLFEDIVGESFTTIMDDLLRAGSLARLEKEKGRPVILAEYGNDMRNLSPVIDSFGSGNRSKTKREYRVLNETILAQKAGLTPASCQNLLTELKTSIRLSTLGFTSSSEGIL